MDAEKFGAFISQCRKEKQMTQAELAARLQVTDKAVSRWERGIGFPDNGNISAPSSEFWLSSYCYSCGWITCSGNWIPSSSQGSA